MTRAPDFTVLTQTDDFAVINKPAGLRAVPAKGADTDPELADSVETRARALFGIPSEPIIVHRLDRDTSGIMVLGLTRAAHRALSRQFMHRKVGKSYTAVLDARLEHDEGAVDLPICVDWPNRPKHSINFDQGKPSRTLYRVVDRTTSQGQPVTRVDFKPITGRTHQLRVHAMLPVDASTVTPFPDNAADKAVLKLTKGGLGAPISGDTLYGPDVPTATRLLLHAYHLAFWDPTGGQWLKFDCEPGF